MFLYLTLALPVIFPLSISFYSLNIFIYISSFFHTKMVVTLQGPILLRWINLNLGMDKLSLV